MLKLLLLFSLFFSTSIYGQDSLKEIINKKTVSPGWVQLLVLKKEWKLYASVTMKNDEVKKIHPENSNGSVIFTNDSMGLRPYQHKASFWPVEYLQEQNFYLAIGLLRNGQPPGPSPYKVYSLDSTYLVVEEVDYFTFAKQTNYTPKSTDTTASGNNSFPLSKPIGAPVINIRIGGANKKILWVYKAND